MTVDVTSRQPGDLSLKKGMSVEGKEKKNDISGIFENVFYFYHVVLYIGKGNYWEGKVNNEQGWFPKSAITVSGIYNADNKF